MIFVEELVLAQKKDYFKENSSGILQTATAIVLPSKPLLKSIPENFYLQNIGVICKKEWKFEKATKIPLKVRVGSLQQCNWMEGKKYWDP